MEERIIIPTTTRQAFKILDGMLSEEEKKAIVAKDKSEFTIDSHFGLGAWIRNNWIYADKEGEGLFAPDLNACQVIYVDPDMKSAEFLGKYYDHLKRTLR